MKKLLVTALFGAFAVAQEAAPTAEVPSKHKLDYTLDLVSGMGGTDATANGTYGAQRNDAVHDFKYSYKLSDDYTWIAQAHIHTGSFKQADGTNKNKLFEEFVRLQLNGPTFAKVLGFETQWQVRYILPVTNGDQITGTFGRFVPRLVMTQEFSSYFNLTLIPRLNLFMPRNSFKMRDPKDGRADLVSAILEIAPQFVLMEGLTFTIDTVLAATLQGKTHTESSTAYEYEYDTEFELMYNISSLGDLGVGLIAEDDFLFGNHSNAKFFDPDNMIYGLRIQKGFSL